jgi:hypothetical protein
MEYGYNTRIIILKRFLNEILELHFAIPNKTHPVNAHVKSIIINTRKIQATKFGK